VEAALAALFVYRQRVDPEATLTVVGRPSVQGYARALRRYAADLGLLGAVRFAGRVDEAGLAACYQAADVLVVASVHEGFCLPAVEAMARGVPVVAFRQGALPEVLGDGGVLVDSLDPVTLADAVASVVADPHRRRAVVAAGAAQLTSLHLDQAAARLADLLVAVHDRTPWPDGVAARGGPPTH
jgi:glycosyltransferase involved in cell wall biosynthesis